MRDIRFIAKHRGGSLELEDHRALMRWALACVEHILPLAPQSLGLSLYNALEIGHKWIEGNATTGEAMKTSREVHALARTLHIPVMKLIARAIGQAVATAHMADHCVGSAWYARKIRVAVGETAQNERKWQEQQLEKLPGHIELLVKEYPKFLAKP